MDKLKVGIVGVSGYGGGELYRLLASHPNVEISYVTSHTYVGQTLDRALPGIAPTSLICAEFDVAACTDACDFVFLAGESGMAMRVAPSLLDAGKKIVDLSADFRLRDVAAYADWYKLAHTAPELLPAAVYGLPELNRDKIKKARLVANPGCHVTAAVLALAPLVSAGFVETETLIVDSLTGVSGAGRSKFGLDYHFSEINESVRAYGVGGVHRHTPEIEQVLTTLTDNRVLLTFTPHLVPVTRGILATCYATLASNWDKRIDDNREKLLLSLYQGVYADAPFVKILPPGEFPATKHVTGTNFCHLGLTQDKRTNRVIVVSAIDNLVKGAAGQAIQNMNLMCGFDETAGLTGGAVWP